MHRADLEINDICTHTHTQKTTDMTVNFSPRLISLSPGQIHTSSSGFNPICLPAKLYQFAVRRGLRSLINLAFPLSTGPNQPDQGIYIFVNHIHNQLPEFENGLSPPNTQPDILSNISPGSVELRGVTASCVVASFISIILSVALC